MATAQDHLTNLSPSSLARFPRLPHVPAGSGRGADEGRRLTAWLVAHPHWQQVLLHQLGTRLDMIRRLRFDKPASLAPGNIT